MKEGVSLNATRDTFFNGSAMRRFFFAIKLQNKGALYNKSGVLQTKFSQNLSKPCSNCITNRTENRIEHSQIITQLIWFASFKVERLHQWNRRNLGYHHPYRDEPGHQLQLAQGKSERSTLQQENRMAHRWQLALWTALYVSSFVRLESFYPRRGSDQLWARLDRQISFRDDIQSGVGGGWVFSSPCGHVWGLLQNL